MTLFFHEFIHLSLSLLIGLIIWKLWCKKISVIIATLLGGFFIDLDHLFEYFLAYGFSFDWRLFVKGDQFEAIGKIILPLHAWEYVIILIIVSVLIPKDLKQLKFVFFAFAFALFGHLLIDAYFNVIPIISYSIIKRFLVNFELGKLLEL